MEQQFLSKTQQAGAIRTTCPYCGVGCGVLVEAGPQPRVSGDPLHPANRGRLCSKGSALAETIGLEDRLLTPMIGGRRVTWDAAFSHVASGIAETIARYGPDSVAFYVSGQLLTEDYYLANKLMKGYIGSANIDTNSRLCMASSVAGHKRAFGEDVVPGCYEDLELADLIVLTGSNLAWCHPVLFQRILAAKEKRRNLKLVVIDPRRTASADLADMHLAIAPGSDVALFNGLLNWLEVSGATDPSYVSAHVEGADHALQAAGQSGFAGALAQTGLAADELRAFYSLFAATERVVTVYSQGINQAADGVDRVNAVINCHLLTGRIGRPGMGPFSITGQPNAMGGREVGGLANQLACHLSLENAGHRSIVQSFWQSPKMAAREGLKAVDMFDAVADGRIKAIWIMATNPVVSMPNADRVTEALRNCDLVVVSDVAARTDTLAYADVVLPAAAWGEKDGTVTNSERRISRQRAFMVPPGEALPDWRIICGVAQKMGWAEGFSYSRPYEIFREYAFLSAAANQGERVFDLGGLTGLDAKTYDALNPVQWPVIGGEDDSEARFFGDGDFPRPGGKAVMVPTPCSANRRPVEKSGNNFVLNTGRVRDHWHTMTRTARSPRLSQHLAEPYVEINPKDAHRLGLAPADIARLCNKRGEILVRVLVSEHQRPGSVFVPIHWTDQFSSNARVDRLVAPITDPISGQPASKSSMVSVQRFEAAWYGFGVSCNEFSAPDADYWALAKAETGFRLELAGTEERCDWRNWALALLDCEGRNDLDILSCDDTDGGGFRIAILKDDTFLSGIYISRHPVQASRAYLSDMLGEQIVTSQARAALLAGRAFDASQDRGAIVCSCMGVGAKTIEAAIVGGAQSLDCIAERTKAGTNCGSCRPEIKRLLEAIHAE